MIFSYAISFFCLQPKKFNEKKIKKKDLIHPRSRKADQVNRAKLRKQKLEGAHDKLMLRKNATGKRSKFFVFFFLSSLILVLRLSWFQEILKGSETGPTMEDMEEWIKMYYSYSYMTVIYFIVGTLIDLMMK